MSRARLFATLGLVKSHDRKNDDFMRCELPIGMEGQLRHATKRSVERNIRRGRDRRRIEFTVTREEAATNRPGRVNEARVASATHAMLGFKYSRSRRSPRDSRCVSREINSHRCAAAAPPRSGVSHRPLSSDTSISRAVPGVSCTAAAPSRSVTVLYFSSVVADARICMVQYRAFLGGQLRDSILGPIGNRAGPLTEPHGRPTRPLFPLFMMHCGRAR